MAPADKINCHCGCRKMVTQKTARAHEQGRGRLHTRAAVSSHMRSTPRQTLTRPTGGRAGSGLQAPSASAQQRALASTSSSDPLQPPARDPSPNVYSDSQNPQPDFSSANSPVSRYIIHDDLGARDDDLEMDNSSDDESPLYVDPDDADGWRTVEDEWDELWELEVVTASACIMLNQFIF